MGGLSFTLPGINPLKGPSMKYLLLLLLLLAPAFGSDSIKDIKQLPPVVVADPAPTKPQPVITESFEVFAKRYYDAVYTLYTQKDDGGYDMHCTMTAFKSKPEGKKFRVRFVTAGHCVQKLPQVVKILFDAEDIETSYFVSQDDSQDEKVYIRAKLIAKGNLSTGNDFAVFEALTSVNVPTVPVGVDPTSIFDEPVVNVADPMGIGLQVFDGKVTRLSLDRHTGPAGSDWYGDILVQMHGVNGGSSGSSMVCRKQRAICGFIIGSFDGTTMVAVPVSKFSKWYADVENPKPAILTPFKLKPLQLPKGPSKPKKPSPKK